VFRGWCGKRVVVCSGIIVLVQRKVLKRNGVIADFDRSILERSLIRAGASNELANKISISVESEINDGDTTSDIYRNAFNMLSDKSKNIAMRYSLKKALFSLGPTGFPFEKFIAEIFRRKGYAVSNNVHLNGHCISHEVDVLTTSPERIAMEVKFHNDMRNRSDVKSVLYIKARFDDLTFKNSNNFFKKKGVVDRCILITNTKFTKNAISYAKCSGVSLLGWGYPYKENLQTYIEKEDVHPVTCLPSITVPIAKNLFSKGIVTCRGLLENKTLLKSLPNSEAIASEAEMLCVSHSRQ